MQPREEAGRFDKYVGISGCAIFPGRCIVAIASCASGNCINDDSGLSAGIDDDLARRFFQRPARDTDTGLLCPVIC